MGNQLPVKCVAACNPTCCVNCINPQTGRPEDGETGVSQKAGNIFANSASVLSTAAEEISLDDHLEREMANEVELWRLENSTATAQMKGFSTATSSRSGLAGLVTHDASHGRDLPEEHRFLRGTCRDRSNSPPMRTQVSLHDRLLSQPMASGASLPSMDSLEEEKEIKPGMSADSRAGFKESSTRESTNQAADGLLVAADDHLPFEHGSVVVPPTPWAPTDIDLEVSSEDSTFRGFIEESQDRDEPLSASANGEFHVYFRNLPTGPKHNGSPFGSFQVDPASVHRSISRDGSEASRILADRSMF